MEGKLGRMGDLMSSVFIRCREVAQGRVWADMLCIARYVSGFWPSDVDSLVNIDRYCSI